MQLINGDCIEAMATIPDGSIDMVLTDPPYGTTACKWDSIIPLEPMWEQLKRITKKNGAIVMTASQPFTTKLISSNMGMFKYEWIWEKEQGVNFQCAKTTPLKIHENVCVWCEGKTTYNPQGILACNITKSNKGKSGRLNHVSVQKRDSYTQTTKNYPKTIQKFRRKTGLHPTQKPVALMEYMIKTYTNEGETVLDFTMGSGTTGVACQNLGRDFIGIELDPEYFSIAKERIESAQMEITCN
jgi:site-specific DNA-methyltransferase (adenine-specific)